MWGGVGDYIRGDASGVGALRSSAVPRARGPLYLCGKRGDAPMDEFDVPADIHDDDVVHYITH